MQMWRLFDDINLSGGKRKDPAPQDGGRCDGRPAENRHLPFRALAGLLVVVIAWLAFRPSVGADQGLPWDKANHALAFLVLTMVSTRGWPGAGGWRLGAVMLVGGAAIEVIQGLPAVGRDRDGWDVVADMAGFGLGWIAVLGLRWLRGRGGFRE